MNKRIIIKTNIIVDDKNQNLCSINCPFFENISSRIYCILYKKFMSGNDQSGFYRCYDCKNDQQIFENEEYLSIITKSYY